MVQTLHSPFNLHSLASFMVEVEFDNAMLNFQQVYVGTKMTKKMSYTQCKDYQNTDEEPNLKFRCILGSFFFLLQSVL